MSVPVALSNGADVGVELRSTSMRAASACVPAPVLTLDGVVAATRSGATLGGATVREPTTRPVSSVGPVCPAAFAAASGEAALPEVTAVPPGWIAMPA
jgi:hypothetical protein